jgi:hypothetical protein
MFVKIKNIYINTDHVSMISLKEDWTLVVDFSYSKEDGQPVFLAFSFDDEEAANAALNTLLA